MGVCYIIILYSVMIKLLLCDYFYLIMALNILIKCVYILSFHDIDWHDECANKDRSYYFPLVYSV